jgi:hypothetical protein
VWDTAVYQHIGKLDIAVNDLFGSNVHKCLSHLVLQREREGERERESNEALSNACCMQMQTNKRPSTQAPRDRVNLACGS